MAKSYQMDVVYPDGKHTSFTILQPHWTDANSIEAQQLLEYVCGCSVVLTTGIAHDEHVLAA